MEKIKIKNVSLLNIIFFIFSQACFVVINQIMSYFYKHSEIGGRIALLIIIGSYLFAFMFILLLKDDKKQEVESETDSSNV